MNKREIRKIVSTLAVIAAMMLLGLILGSCYAPAPGSHSSVQPPVVSVPAENPAVPPESEPAVLPAEPIERPEPLPGQKTMQTPAKSAASGSETQLTRAQAEAAALKHAGLTAAQVKGLHSEFDIDDGIKEYEVEFRYDGWAYDYEVNAVTGAIRSFDKERD